MKRMMVIVCFICLVMMSVIVLPSSAEALPRQFPLSVYKIGGYDFSGPVRYTDGRFWHLGEDASAKAGTEVLAPAEGKVMFSGYAGSFGYVVILEQTDGYCTIFGHLGKNGRSAAGTTLKIGAKLGIIGSIKENGGWAEHLHWGVYQGAFGSKQGLWPSWAMGRATASKSMPAKWMDPTDWVNSKAVQPVEPVQPPVQQPITTQPKESTELRLDIRRAMYGNGDKTADVTQNVRGYIQQDARIDLQVSNYLCGYDPVVNIAKQLIVTYRNRWNEEYRITVREGDWLRLTKDSKVGDFLTDGDW